MNQTVRFLMSAIFGFCFGMVFGGLIVGSLLFSYIGLGGEFVILFIQWWLLR